MLHRSASSRRRRASRSVTSSSQSSTPQQQQQSAARTRRASLASSEPTAETPRLAMDRQRSPRGSCVPNIALDSEDHIRDEMSSRRLLPDPEQFGASRLSLAPEATRSSRNSLVPDEWSQGARSPRGSLVPEPSRSGRNSLVPEAQSRSPRHSLVPMVEPQSLSPRNSLVPLLDVAYNRSPRGSIAPTSLAAAAASRSPRHSLVPDTSRSPRGSIANIEFERNPRGSICPEQSASSSRSPRGSISPMDMKERSPRGSIASECMNQSPRGSICPEPSSSNRSPRGSICPEPSPSNRSPRGSIAPYDTLGNRSPRGSIAGHRGSIGGAEDEPAARSPRGSIGGLVSDLERSPRGSLAGNLTQDRRQPRPGSQTNNQPATQQDPRRHSQDHGTTKSGTGGPYRLQREDNSGSVRSVVNASATAQVNLAYSWSDSRRPSSSVSQFSGDESRRLCEVPRGTLAGGLEKGIGGGAGGAPVGVAAYGSLVFQLKDAHLEANGTCDFVLRALRVVSKTTPVTVFLALLSTMPIIMLILGVQFIRDCPREPHIPVYMVVGGSLGSIRMFWTLYSQIRSRRPEVLTVPGSRSLHLSPTKLASVALSCFLLGWFALGNYWILSIRWPDYAPTLFEPNRWCHKTLYIFSLLHLFIVYLVIFISLLTGLGLLFCRLLACPWPERYK